jgi:hypothetical protein
MSNYGSGLGAFFIKHPGIPLLPDRIMTPHQRSLRITEEKHFFLKFLLA